jgi:predicted SAM-dependent methyltransferase
VARPLYRAARTVVGRARLSWTHGSCKIIVGAASMRAQRGWVPTDIDFLDLRNESDWLRYFHADSVEAILAEHVWEHMDADDARIAAEHCLRFLKPGGYVRAAVPDGLHPDPNYIEWVRPGGSGAGAHDHKVLYTYHSFRELFESAGFDVRLLEYFDENGQFHFADWNPADGLLRRSKRYDPRNGKALLAYTSIILDARKVRRDPAPRAPV